MTLDEYLRTNSLTETSFAASVGLSQAQINRLRRGGKPSWATIERIHKTTSGQVSAADFFQAEAAE